GVDGGGRHFAGHLRPLSCVLFRYPSAAVVGGGGTAPLERGSRPRGARRGGGVRRVAEQHSRGQRATGGGEVGDQRAGRRLRRRAVGGQCGGVRGDGSPGGEEQNGFGGERRG